MISCDASSSVQHCIDVTEQHFSPRTLAFGSEIQLYTCVSILVSFRLVGPLLSFSRATPLQLLRLSMSGCRRGRESAASPLLLGPAMRL
ncbi:hypothetical protein VZT92_014039 [Zoarces viviparus]|uniref:Uncharacterized protein n=1 Tax=Zoarces viviparus TaxID=48416 RepID=A0AAW1EYK9_ZOAVI